MNGTEGHLIRMLAELDAPDEAAPRAMLPSEAELIAALDRLLAP
jgi:hypothetical protein